MFIVIRTVGFKFILHDFLDCNGELAALVIDSGKDPECYL